MEEQTSALSHAPEKPLVLVVDDDPIVRVLMREVLEQEGFSVEDEEEGKAALNTLGAAERRPPDIILLDALMPGMDGFAVLNEMHKLRDRPHFPVVMVTSLDDTESVQRAYAAGATDFLTKPIHWPNLANHVRYLLRANRAIEELSRSRFFFHSILRDIPVFVCRWAPDGTIEFVNEAYCRYFGKSAAELTGHSFMPLIPQGDREKIREHIAAISQERPLVTFENRAIRGDGEIRWQRWTNRALFDENGNLSGIQSIGEDITEQKQAEKNLLLAREVFENSDELIAVTDLNADIIDVNPAFLRLTGYGRDEIIGQNMVLLKLECHDHQFYEHHADSLRQEGRWQGEMRGRCKNGKKFTCLMTINAVNGDQGEPTHYVSLATDITRLKKVEEKLQNLAFFDPLTALPNRDLLHDRLQQAIYEARRDQSILALLFLDLDNFRDINDTLGHPIGDLVLAQAAYRFKEHTRHSDTVARMGGDEFVIVVRNIAGAESACRIAQGMLKDLSAPFAVNGRKIYLTLSIGIALYPPNGGSADELIKKAETAMYHAKSQGKNRYLFFSEEMNIHAQERLSLLTNLRRALERDEFVLHYQPKIDLATGEVTGVEALIRWQQPEAGLIPPASFIPLAEETGLILPIGSKVLQMACAQVKSWQSQGLPALPVAVNLSAVQLREDNLALIVGSILREMGLAPRWLELEITESAIMQNTERAVSILAAMKEMGIRLTMDDFGTGYSSLSYLKRFPISTIKIDRSFIGELLTDGGDAVIIRAIIAMAHHLQMKVVAEGVENADQLEFLRREGCDEVQGYHIARPMPAAEFGRWFRNRDSRRS
jgi:diguanylate cyclase (GGDEF)-like protein/PAS domain S-box-containing protein